VVLTLRVTGADLASREVLGSVELHQFAGTTRIGPAVFIPYDTSPAGGSATIHVPFLVPRYGATPEAVWRVTKVTAHDGAGPSRILRGDALAAYGAEFRVTQLVDADAPVLDGIALGAGQSPTVVDPGTGVTVRYLVTVSDPRAGVWKGRLVLAGPDGRQAVGRFAVASDGRHLTCGSGSLIDDIHDHVECDVPVDLPAGAPAGTWTVARVALIDQAENDRVVARPAAPAVSVTRG
jgi:hypothetical protein